jgi:hypothetical protein
MARVPRHVRLLRPLAYSPQLDQLERKIDSLTSELAQPLAESTQPPRPPRPEGVRVPQPNAAAELESLRARTRELSAEVQALEAMPAENARLKAQAVANLGLTPEAVAELGKAREKAQSVACVNNLKQLGLAARVWAVDDGDVLPPDLLSMSHEIAAPKVLICPADPGRQPASDWLSFTPANTSYEFLAANSTATEPQRVAFRCPIHGNIGLVDGSVQMGVAKHHPEWLVSREGKLMLEVPRSAEESPTAPAGQVPQMDRRMLERYGLVPLPNQSAPTAPQPAPAREEQAR